MNTVIDGMSVMSTVLNGLGNFKPKGTEFFQTFLWLAQFWPLFSCPPLKWHSCSHGFYYLWTSHSYLLLLTFNYCFCSFKILLSCPFTLSLISCSPLLCGQQFPSSLTYVPRVSAERLLGCMKVMMSLRAYIPVRRWMEITVKYSTNI